MAEFTWTFDVTDSVYKNHALSSKMRETSVAQSVVMEHFNPEPNFGKGRGESVTITRIHAITEPTTAQLTENVPIPEDTFAISHQRITVAEFGRAIPYTSLSEDLTDFNVQNQVQRELLKQMRLVLDTRGATALKSGQIKYAVTGLSSNNITTNGAFGATSSQNMNVTHAALIRDRLMDIQFLDPDASGEYKAVFRTKGLRGIKDDPLFEEWHKYTTPEMKANSEVGKVEQIRFQETNHSNAFGTVGTGSVLGEGVVFSEDVGVLIEAVTPELRIGLAQDYGRRKLVAWYGVLQWAQPYSDSGNAGQARSLHVGSL